LSCNSLPAPMVSPLVPDYVDQIRRAADACNRLRPASVELRTFDTLAEGIEKLATIANELQLGPVPSRA